jgi:hypothetical protein
MLQNSKLKKALSRIWTYRDLGLWASKKNEAKYKKLAKKDLHKKVRKLLKQDL